MQKLHEKCIRCGRKLKTPASKELGFGKICWEKWNNDDGITKPLFSLEDCNEEKNN
jgi:hypothetical protein